jgi:putative PIN family toxin of toxin-antitoxin system
VLVVLDTSVVVAALRSRRGASFELLRLLRAGKFSIAVSVPLVLEYEAVLLRHARELSLRPQEATGLLDYLCSVGHRQEIYFLWRPTLTDPRDEFILELAVAAGCQAIVTHNTRDFENARGFGIDILTPAAFLGRLAGGKP